MLCLIREGSLTECSQLPCQISKSSHISTLETMKETEWSLTWFGWIFLIFTFGTFIFKESRSKVLTLKWQIMNTAELLTQELQWCISQRCTFEASKMLGIKLTGVSTALKATFFVNARLKVKGKSTLPCISSFRMIYRLKSLLRTSCFLSRTTKYALSECLKEVIWSS